MLFPQQTPFTAQTKATEPPVHSQRSKKICEPRTRVELLVDSFLEPGLRGQSAAYTQRHLLYRAEPYHLDLLIEMHPDGNRLIVTGQLLDLSHPVIFGRDVKIALSNGRQGFLSLNTSELGEFWGEIENSGELAVSLMVRNREIAVSMRHVLGRHRLDS